MQVTEENLTEYNLNQKELEDLISLVKKEIKNHEQDPVGHMYYSMILGKLMIMRYNS